MRVTVVVPTYNRADLIAETLQSILDQTHTDWEAIVVDDGSSDSTSEIMGEWCAREPRIRYVVQENSGAQVARNRGLAEATGEIVIFNDSDDLFHPEKLADHVRMMSAQPDLDGTITQALWFKDRPEDGHKVWNRILTDQVLEHFVAQDILWGTPSGAWRREFLNRMGGWRVGVKSSQDVDFHIRAALEGHKIGIIPEVRCWIRIHDGPRVSGISRSKWIVDVVNITDFCVEEFARRGMLDDRWKHVLAANYLWCARKQARDDTLDKAREYARKGIELEPSGSKRGLLKLLMPLFLRITHHLKPFYYASYLINLALGLETKRYNWHQQYTTEDWLRASRF